MVESMQELTLHHELLDSQHAELFRRLADVAQTFDGPEAGVEAAVAALADALVTHLAAEERIMDEALYPERARHKSAHELFMADFLHMRAELHEEGPTPALAEWLMQRIPDWLRFHITVNDVPLGIFLSRRKPQPMGVRPGSGSPGGQRPC